MATKLHQWLAPLVIALFLSACVDHYRFMPEQLGALARGDTVQPTDGPEGQEGLTLGELRTLEPVMDQSVDLDTSISDVHPDEPWEPTTSHRRDALRVAAPSGLILADSRAMLWGPRRAVDFDTRHVLYLDGTKRTAVGPVIGIVGGVLGGAVLITGIVFGVMLGACSPHCFG